jgi:hypothetical protein
MKLIKTPDYQGYKYDEIVKKYPEFKKYFFGQTVGIYKGKMIVYKWDLERFLKGLEPFD